MWVPVPGPVSPTISSFFWRSANVLMPERLWAMQTLVSVVGLPSHVNFCASNVAFLSPVSGASDASRAMMRRHLRQHADHRAVLGRDAVNVVCGDQAAGPRHVLRHHRRVAGNVLAHVTRKRARPGVVAAAGTETDDHGHLFAFVEIGDRLRLRRGERDCGQGERKGRITQNFHVSSPWKAWGADISIPRRPCPSRRNGKRPARHGAGRFRG